MEPLSQYALLKISGADAGHFLQGQLTNDVFQLGAVMNATPGEVPASEAATWDTPKWQLSAYCNPKGRVLALLYVWKRGDDFFALLDQDLVAPISDRLRMFVMRSKVTIETLPEAIVYGGACNDAAADSGLAELELDRAQHGTLLTTAETSVLVINNRLLVVDLQGGKEAAPGSQHTPDTDWLLADIEQGIPHVGVRTSELFIPQMLNLDLLGGISFKKGCYTGQEIVARMHYLGNLKQRMFSVTIRSIGELNANMKHQAADKVYADPELGKSVGQLASIQGDRALAVLRLESIENMLYLEAGTSLQVDSTQPYPLDRSSNG